jgi:MFS family permease
MPLAVPIAKETAGKGRFFYGYIAVAAASVIMMLTFGSLYCFGVFFKPFLTEFGWSRAETSGAFSLSFFMQGLLGIPVGKLNDRYGPRLVTTVAAFFLGGGFMLLSLIHAVWQFYFLYGIVIALGVSSSIVLMAIPPRWFVKRRGLMTGVVISGVGLGTVLMPPFATWLITTFNWRTSYIILGSAILLIMLTAGQFLRRDPQQMGLTPYGYGTHSARAMNTDGREFSFSEAFRTWQFWMLGILFFFHTYAVQTVMAHTPLYAQGVGLSAAGAAGIISVVGGASIFGRLILGTVLDRIGSRPILAVCFLVKAAALTWLIFARAEWMFYVFAVTFGFSYGGAAVGHSPMVADLFGLMSLSMILAGVSFVGTLGSAGGPVVAGRIFDVSGSYFWAFMACVILSVVGFIMTLFVKPVSKGEH